MENVHFSNIRSQIIRLLQESTSEVKVAMAWFTNNELFEELLACVKRGVDVQLILLDDEINYHPYAPDFNELISLGGVLRIAPVLNGFMHHKFCVIDRNTVITGSYNWTYYAETRNLENIIISTDDATVGAYLEEFRHLQDVYPTSGNSRRVSWDTIGQSGHVDMDVLNYEVSCISAIKNLPQQKVFKSSTTIEVVEKRFNPKAACQIGIQGDDDDMYAIIEEGVSLPYSNKISFYNYPDRRNQVECRVVYGNSAKASENYLLAERSLVELVAGNHPEALQIAIHVTLVPSGLMNVEIRCLETGKAVDLITTNKELVRYE